MLRRSVIALASIAVVTTGALVSVPASQAAETPLIVWADPDAVPALEAIFATGYDGREVVIEGKTSEQVQAELPTATEATGPDIVQFPAELSESWAAARLIVPVKAGSKVLALYPANVIAGAQVGGTTYGMPITVDSVALITNTTLVPKHPKSFAALSKKALAIVAAGKADIPLALPQGEAGNVYATYPLFSGLGGYLFASPSPGVLDPKDVGIASAGLLANASLIDGWNATGLVRASISEDQARRHFLAGRAPFWVARTSDVPTIMKLRFPYRITALPTIVEGQSPVPLLSLSAFGVTRFAAAHGVAKAAQAMVTKELTKGSTQSTVAGDLGLLPATTGGVSALATDGVAARIRAFGLAGARGVAVPPIAAMGAVWGPLGSAWVSSTAGPSSVPAKRSFRAAQRAVTAAIG